MTVCIQELLNKEKQNTHDKSMKKSSKPLNLQRRKTIYNGFNTQHPLFQLPTLHIIFSLFHLITQHSFNFYLLQWFFTQHPNPSLFIFIFLFKFYFYFYNYIKLQLSIKIKLK